MKDLHYILSFFLACKWVYHLESYIIFLSLKKCTLLEKMHLESYFLFLPSSIIMWLVFDTHSIPSQVVIILPKIKCLLINSIFSGKIVKAAILLILRHIKKLDRPIISHYVYLVVYLETMVYLFVEVRHFLCVSKNSFVYNILKIIPPFLQWMCEYSTRKFSSNYHYGRII